MHRIATIFVGNRLVRLILLQQHLAEIDVPLFSGHHQRCPSRFILCVNLDPGTLEQGLHALVGCLAKLCRVVQRGAAVVIDGPSLRTLAHQQAERRLVIVAAAPHKRCGPNATGPSAFVDGDFGGDQRLDGIAAPVVTCDVQRAPARAIDHVRLDSRLLEQEVEHFNMVEPRRFPKRSGTIITFAGCVDQRFAIRPAEAQTPEEQGRWGSERRTEDRTAWWITRRMAKKEPHPGSRKEAGTGTHPATVALYSFFTVSMWPARHATRRAVSPCWFMIPAPTPFAATGRSDLAIWSKRSEMHPAVVSLPCTAAR